MNGFDVLEGLEVFLVWILRRTVEFPRDALQRR
jgi:hypothetical protein